MAINLAVIGCGLIGKRRIREIAKDPLAHLALAVDVDPKNLEGLNCKISSEWQEAVRDPKIDAIVISTPNHLTSPIAIAALSSGKDILVEKPLGRNSAESQKIVSASSNRLIKTGFNHRFHPAIRQAKDLIDCGKIGKLLSIRGRYGHGGRPGMEKEWRASKELCGGGELLDQGIHLIDLIRWFGGEFSEVCGMTETKYWNMAVEDNAFVIGKTAKGVNLIFHVSWTHWKNIFSFELFGSDGYIAVNGLGGSYGIETLELGIRNPLGGKPEISTFEFPGEDKSWELEWIEFRDAILQRRQPLGNGDDGLKANQAIDAIFKSCEERRVVNL